VSAIQAAGNRDYIFTNVEPGMYTVPASMKRFKQFQKTDIPITASQAFNAGVYRPPLPPALAAAGFVSAAGFSSSVTRGSR
jgi:hypothetical protein